MKKSEKRPLEMKKKGKKEMTVIESLGSYFTKETAMAITAALVAGGAAVDQARAASQEVPGYVNEAIESQVHDVTQAIEDLKRAMAALSLSPADQPETTSEQAPTDATESEASKPGPEQAKKPEAKREKSPGIGWDEDVLGGDPFSDSYRAKQAEIESRKENFVSTEAANLAEKVFLRMMSSEKNAPSDLSAEAQKACSVIKAVASRTECTSRVIRSAEKQIDERLMNLASKDPEKAYAMAPQAKDQGVTKIDVALRSGKAKFFEDWLENNGILKPYAKDTPTYKLQPLMDEGRLNDLTAIYPDLSPEYRVLIRESLQHKLDYYNSQTPDASVGSGNTDPFAANGPTDASADAQRWQSQIQMILDATSGYD